MLAVQQLTKQFDIDAEEAYNLLAQGAQNGLNKNGNLLDTLNEFGPKFKMVGMSAQEMFNSLKNGTDAGVFDMDKLGDAVNEFSIGIQDGTADEALEGLGFNVDATVAKFKRGGNDAKEVFVDVMSRLDAMEDKTKQNAYDVQLMASMWEDTGGEPLMALKNITGEINRQKNAIEELNSTQYNDLSSTVEGIKRDFMTNLSGSMDDLNSYLAENADEIKAELKPWRRTLGKLSALL